MRGEHAIERPREPVLAQRGERVGIEIEQDIGACLRHAAGETPLWVDIVAMQAARFVNGSLIVVRTTNSSYKFRTSFGVRKVARGVAVGRVAHSITSSVRARKRAGTVRPRDLAVRMLIASSNFFRRRTGSSPEPRR